MNAPTTIVAPAPAPVHREVPRADTLLIVAVVVVGVAAAAVGNPLLWIATPVIAAMLMLVARQAPVPPRPVDDDMAELPAEVRRVVRATRAQLPDGDALRMLNDVVRPARALLGARESAFSARDDDATRTHVVELLDDACAIALDLARIDAVAPIGASADGGQRHRAAHALFEKRLGEASLALAALYASGVEHGTPASDRIAELVAELRAEASVRSAAQRELDALLRAHTPPSSAAIP